MTAHRIRIRGLRIHHQGWYWQASCAVCGPHQAGARVWADLVEWAVAHYVVARPSSGVVWRGQE